VYDIRGVGKQTAMLLVMAIQRHRRWWHAKRVHGVLGQPVSRSKAGPFKGSGNVCSRGTGYVSNETNEQAVWPGRRRSDSIMLGGMELSAKRVTGAGGTTVYPPCKGKNRHAENFVLASRVTVFGNRNSKR